MKKIRLHFDLAGGWVDPPEQKIGALLTDGTIYAGSTTPASADAPLDGLLSAHGGFVDPQTPASGIYAAPTDAPLTMTFTDAADYASKLNRGKYLGHDDWRVPTKAELNVLFNNHAAIGGLNVTGSNPLGWYWSSFSDSRWDAWGQDLNDGDDGYYLKDFCLSVRLVRSPTLQVAP